jgi:hypothetical protein
MLRMIALVALTALTPALASAEERLLVTEREAFLARVEGRDITLPTFGLTLRLDPTGQIEGSALGWDVTGTWEWRDGMFCRVMDWSGKEIAPDCQTVEVISDTSLRFTAEYGQGKSATFRLR